MNIPLYNECIARIANAYAEAYSLRDWCALEFYMNVTQPHMYFDDIIKDWVSVD
jgi:hypothetical protein